MKCNANINFNKICIIQHITPKYAKTKIKQLYKKKQLNKDLHHAHIQAGNIWASTWQHTMNTNNNKLNTEMNIIYNKQKNKINTQKKKKMTTWNTINFII
jgi:hypothetical protein